MKLNKYPLDNISYSFLLFLMASLTAFGQSKKEYLQANRFDLSAPTFQFPQTDFNVIGFGAYHGSAKTYAAEYALLKDLQKRGVIKYYIPETNFSQAFFFQQYLDTGDEALLKELTLAFQTIVGQEGTIETFEHWKKLRALNQVYSDNPLKVIGCDAIAEYKFPIKHLLLLTQDIQNWESKTALERSFMDQTTDFSTRNEELQTLLKTFITDYQQNKNRYAPNIKDTADLHHIISNLEYTFTGEKGREEIIFANYIYLKDRLQLEQNKQFFKYGFFHIEKERERDYPSFFTRLIEENIYPRNRIITIMGYLTKSEVLWDKIYDEEGNYKTYTTEQGFGIGDYWKEYFKGIKKLKQTKLSDLTLFKLNATNSPFNRGTDLIEVKLLFSKSNGKAVRGKSTTDFIDYAVLISNSKNQIPLEEME